MWCSLYRELASHRSYITLGWPDWPDQRTKPHVELLKCEHSVTLGTSGVTLKEWSLAGSWGIKMWACTTDTGGVFSDPLYQEGSFLWSAICRKKRMVYYEYLDYLSLASLVELLKSEWSVTCIPCWALKIWTICHLYCMLSYQNLSNLPFALPAELSKSEQPVICISSLKKISGTKPAPLGHRLAVCKTGPFRAR